MECWPPARRAYASERIVEYLVLGIWKNSFIGKNPLQKNLKIGHLPLVPLFHHSNIPIGAKPLSSLSFLL